MIADADLAGPLPVGTTVLEASAGTGKTWTIAGLVTRYVAEGHARIDELLVVTFGRAATSELRTRVRERLQDVKDGLGFPSADPVVQLLSIGPAEQVELRRQRLATALASFDSATVSTTHEFCHQVLRALGTVADLDPGTALVESLKDLVTEVCDDLYLRFWGYSKATLPFNRATALALGRRAIGDPEALLLPTGRVTDTDADLRVRFAVAVRREVDRRKRRAKVLGFDDLLGRVRDALADEVTGKVACERLRDRYRIVLVDEFQDTDPVQWEVLHRAFHGHRTLIVIGDPKQAIYAFRGADVSAYLSARESADSEQTLGTNWRSDPRVLDGLAVLLRGAALGDPRIVVRPVAAGHPTVVLGPGTDPAPVRLRMLPRTGLPLSGKGVPLVGRVREVVAADVAAQVVALLRAGHTVTPRGGVARPLEAGDIAVLVRKGAQAQEVRSRLLEVAVPSVLTGTSSVFATAAAQDWCLLLEALEQPHRTGRVRRLALSSFFGFAAVELDGAAGVEAIDELVQQLRGWAEVLADRGVAGLFAVVADQHSLARRLLSEPDGERFLTDLRHVAEVVHGQGVAAALGLAGLVSWLRERVEEATDDLDQERSRRLDTDRAAVQVMTVHTSKGLEFPVVLVPFGWDAFGGGTRERYPRGHDAAGARTLFLAGKQDPDYHPACRAEEVEDAGEELRLLYVAMTRAVSRLILWWAPSTQTDRGPLHRLLLCPDPQAVPPVLALPTDDDALASLRALATGAVKLELVTGAPSRDRAPAVPQADPKALRAADFGRAVDLEWRRLSYSWLTRDVHEAAASVTSESEQDVKDDETDEVREEPADLTDPLHAVASPMADLPGGTSFGTLVHTVLEKADLTAPDLLTELTRHVAEQVQRSGSGYDVAELAAALVPAVSTPLGPLADHLPLKAFAPSDQLTELDFELPLAGGDDPHTRVRLGTVGALLRSHLEAGDPVLAYAALVEAPALANQSLRGYLAGSIDVVLRVGRRYVVVDHKTNRLAGRDVALTAWHYRRAALDRAMLEAHYPLQALLYSVAVHRYLRWRQPAYDPEQHLGGVLYLFLRGMCGDGVVAGVWDWKPPASLVLALSDLLAGTP